MLLKVMGATIADSLPVYLLQYDWNSSEAGKFAKKALLPEPGAPGIAISGLCFLSAAAKFLFFQAS